MRSRHQRRGLTMDPSPARVLGFLGRHGGVRARDNGFRDGASVPRKTSAGRRSMMDCDFGSIPTCFVCEAIPSTDRLVFEFGNDV